MLCLYEIFMTGFRYKKKVAFVHSVKEKNAMDQSALPLQLLTQDTSVTGKLLATYLKSGPSFSHVYGL